MLKISEFSRVCQVSVKTLRYYDEIGLLPPAEVDRWTKYRYYSAEQLPRLRRIIQLKGMGFSLVEIGRILNDSLDAQANHPHRPPQTRRPRNRTHPTTISIGSDRLLA